MIPVQIGGEMKVVARSAGGGGGHAAALSRLAMPYRAAWAIRRAVARSWRPQL